MIKAIMCIGCNGELGQSEGHYGMPWEKNIEDLQYFKEQTEGSIVVMGRKTFESLPFEHGLPERFNYVLSNTGIDTGNFLSDNTTKYRVVDYGKMRKYLKANKKDYWIIGGKSIYEQFMSFVEELHMTVIDQAFPDADTYLNLDFLSDFDKVETLSLNGYSQVEIYRRK